MEEDDGRLVRLRSAIRPFEYERGEYRVEDIQNETLAAVLILLQLDKDEQWQVLFTVRSSELRRHPGEVCFPGGKRESDDRTPIDTALRETNEEIGLPIEHVYILGTLRPMRTRYNLLLFPVMAVLRRPFEPLCNFEVDRTFWAPLALFLSSEYYSPLPISGTLSTTLFKVGDEIIFGITAIVAIVAAMIANQRGPEFDVDLWNGALLGRGSWPDALEVIMARASSKL